MTIETAYADFLDGGAVEAGGTCMSRAVDAALENRCISADLRQKLGGQTLALVASCDLLIAEIFDGRGNAVQARLDTNNPLDKKIGFGVMADISMRGQGIVIVWTKSNHVESLLPASKYKFAEDTMRIDHERQWFLSDHYFAARQANPGKNLRAQTLDEIWDKMADINGCKQLLLLPPQPDAANLDKC